MKTKILSISLLLCLFFFNSYSQKSPTTDYIRNDQLYILSNQHYIKFGDLKNASIGKLLGSPLKIKNEKWETNNAKNNKTYIYASGELVLEDDYLAFINIKKKGLAFAFKIGKSFTKPFAVGDDITELKKLFPVSFKNSKDGIFIPIKTNKGVVTDSSIIFTYSGNRITGLKLFSNES